MGLNHYLIVAAMMFGLGLAGMMKRRNLIMLFFSSEILLNAANLALVIVAIAASEMAVGLGLLILWYKKTGSIELDSFVNFKNPSKDGPDA